LLQCPVWLTAFCRVPVVLVLWVMSLVCSWHVGNLRG
jgi:hypothetical protein